MLNKAILIGNLGKDPEVRYTQGGTAVANFNIATNERRKDAKTGEWQDHTEWHRIVVFGKLAEVCGQYLGKGRQVYIEGRIQSREWEDRDGNKRYTTEIVASEMKMLGAKGAGAEPGRGIMAAEPDHTPVEPAFNAPEDDIPF
jgi:single-strand DNA-binding protein